MFNHFATLLGNLDLTTIRPVISNRLLQVEPGAVLTAGGGVALSLDDFYTLIDLDVKPSAFINPTYRPQALPDQLLKVHRLLFPEGASTYYKEFLLFCYLQLIASTDYKQHVQKDDSRLTYDLRKVAGYFTSHKTHSIGSNNTDFSLLLSGRLTNSERSVSSSHDYLVRQEGTSSVVTVYSVTDQAYIAPGKAPSKQPNGMLVPVIKAMDNSVSLPIALGSTAASFSIAGPMLQFTNTSGKLWAFSIAAPLLFDFLGLASRLSEQVATIDNLFDYHREVCDPLYEQLWRHHHNAVYRVTGLLLGFVNRANLIWDKQAV